MKQNKEIKRKNNLYTADFETTTDEEDCRVWAYGICEIGNPDNFIYGNNIDDFIKWCSNKDMNATLYFHNLKFDGEYIFNYLLNNGYECIEDKKERRNKTFTTLISDLGQFYSIEIFFEVKGHKTNKVTIYDSLKILNFSVEKIAKDFNLPIRKLEINYKEKREKGHILTEKEVDYLRNDVEIMCRALEIMFKEDLKKMTIGSDALSFYKTTISNFDDYYPVLPYEMYNNGIRQSYKGGWVYLNPIYKDKEVKDIMVIDKNSMHPSQMYYEYMPFGFPLYFEGKYTNDKIYPLYIQVMSCSFKLKENKLPTIQIKGSFKYTPTEYLETSNGEIETLYLTNVDYELFVENYDIDNVVYQGGYKFRRIKGLFCKYIDKWAEVKANAKKENNGALYTIAKLMMNSLYGKFGLSARVRGKYPYLSEEGIVKYKLYDEKIRDTIYCPVASFITAYSRTDIIRTSQKIRDYSLKTYGEDYYIYSDTDSIYCKNLSEEELNNIIEIDKYKLGAYDIEGRFKRGKFLRQKCYICEYLDNTLKVTIAGLPKKLGKYINFDNFKEGFNILANDEEKEHKLRFKHVKGGVLLVDTDFTIK